MSTRCTTVLTWIFYYHSSPLRPLILFWIKKLRLRLGKCFLRSCSLLRGGIKNRSFLPQCYGAVVYWSSGQKTKAYPRFCHWLAVKSCMDHFMPVDFIFSSPRPLPSLTFREPVHRGSWIPLWSSRGEKRSQTIQTGVFIGPLIPRQEEMRWGRDTGTITLLGMLGGILLYWIKHLSLFRNSGNFTGRVC